MVKLHLAILLKFSINRDKCWECGESICIVLIKFSIRDELDAISVGH